MKVNIKINKDHNEIDIVKLLVEDYCEAHDCEEKISVNLIKLAVSHYEKIWGEAELDEEKIKTILSAKFYNDIEDYNEHNETNYESVHELVLELDFYYPLFLRTYEYNADCYEFFLLYL